MSSKSEIKNIQNKEIVVSLPVLENKLTNLIYQVDYLDNQGNLVARNIGQTANSNDNLNRIKRHITSDKNDKTCQWLFNNITKVSKVIATVVDTVESYESDKDLKDKLTKLEGYYNAKSHADGIPTINKFTYYGIEYNTYGLGVLNFENVSLEN